MHGNHISRGKHNMVDDLVRLNWYHIIAVRTPNTTLLTQLNRIRFSEVMDLFLSSSWTVLSSLISGHILTLIMSTSRGAYSMHVSTVSRKITIPRTSASGVPMADCKTPWTGCCGMLARLTGLHNPDIYTRTSAKFSMYSTYSWTRL